MGFAYDKNEFVYGSDIAGLQRTSSNVLKPMYLKSLANNDLYLTGWDPVWAWECVMARKSAMRYVTSNPAPTKEWTNSVNYSDLDRIRSGVLDLDHESHAGRFLFDATLLPIDEKVLDGYARKMGLSNWETIFPGLLTTRSRDPEGTIAKMNELTPLSPYLRHTFWYHGVWRRLSHMNDFLRRLFSYIPVGTSDNYVCNTIKSWYFEPWQMSWPGRPDPDSIAGNGREGYVHICVKKEGGKASNIYNEGTARATNMYIDFPYPQPSRSDEDKVFSVQRTYAVIRVQSRLCNSDGSVDILDKYVIQWIKDIDFEAIFSDSNVARLKSLCGITRKPDSTGPISSAMFTGGTSEYIAMEVFDVLVLCQMERTKVAF